MNEKRTREGNRAVNAVREKIQKKFFSEKISISMSETDKDKDQKAKNNLKVGEKFTDKEDKVWYRSENGTLMHETRVGFYGTPMFCPKCESVMGGKESALNNKSWVRWQHCYDCQLEKERLLRMDGKLDEYLEKKKNANIEAYVKDLEDYMISTVLSDSDVKKIISSSEGDMQVWQGMGIKESELKSFQDFIKKIKERAGIDTSNDDIYTKENGKIIKTKNDNKDE